MDFDISYTDKEITPCGGMIFLRQMMDKIGFARAIEQQEDLPRPGSNRGNDPTTIIEGFIASIWCGANRFLHTEVTRHDQALSNIFGWQRTPGQDTYKRFFSKFTQASNQRVSDHFYSWVFDNVRFNNFTLDFDSSVITRYGKQEGSRKGYNPHKPGRPSHHPLIAFVSDVKLVANMWLRSGDTGSANNFLSFLDTLAKLKNKTVSLVRLDSGFHSKEIFEYLEQRQLEYVIAARFYQPIQYIISQQQSWLPIDNGIEIAETMYQSPEWAMPRRVVIVRELIKEHPKAPGKTLRLFEHEEVYQQYRYTAYVTNLKLAAAEVWRLYRGRGDAENRIKEVKYDFGFDSFNLKGFYGTEAALMFAMIAYNLMSIFRQFILQGKTQQTLSTLRYKTFAIGAYFEKVQDSYVLKLALNLKRREWFSGLWNQVKSFDLPFKYSIA